MVNFDFNARKRKRKQKNKKKTLMMSQVPKRDNREQRKKTQ